MIMNKKSISETSAKAGRPISMRKFRGAVNAAGMRMTRQRRTIFRELAGRYDHPDVDQIFQAVKARIPRLSLFTVYRTMNVLESAGLIWRVATWKGHARYDANVEAHAHFLCERCGRIQDVDTGDLGALCQLAGGDVGQIRRVSVTFYGEGPICAHGKSEKQTG